MRKSRPAPGAPSARPLHTCPPTHAPQRHAPLILYITGDSVVAVERPASLCVGMKGPPRLAYARLTRPLPHRSPTGFGWPRAHTPPQSARRRGHCLQGESSGCLCVGLIGAQGLCVLLRAGIVGNGWSLLPPAVT